MTKNVLILVLMAWFLYSCTPKTIFERERQAVIPIVENESTSVPKLIHKTFLIGDAGEDTAKSSPVLRMLRIQLMAADQENATVVFLGDNVYPEGLHDEEHPMRAQDERRIDVQINAVNDFKGNIVFIPGNHDWKKGAEDGLEFVKRQEDYIQDKMQQKSFKPSKGCPGPDVIELTETSVLVVIDTQWWLQKYDKSVGSKDGCDVATKEEFLAEFDEILKKNRDKNVIVAGHHPLYSNGVHGGYFTWKDHLFPLTSVNKKLCIPLPIIGSLYPFYRSFLGNIQDIAHPKYQEMRAALIASMGEYDNVIYVAGHEHNLQYVKQGGLHHIVSGAGSKLSKLKFNDRIDFAAYQKGFAVIEEYDNGEVYLSFQTNLNLDQPEIYRKLLYTKEYKVFGEKGSFEKQSYEGMYKTVVPDSAFVAGGFRRFVIGDLNRDLWTTPLKVPYLDIHKIHGGLTPVGKGGGQQTISLKMIGGDGKEYKLRGIKKSADFLVGRDLRGTIAQDVIYDGIGGSHPYASVVVPKIAHAAQIYYTEPVLVYVPKDSILGDYIDEFGGKFCLLEVHADDDMSEYDNLGNSKKVINYHKVIEKLQKGSDHRVDVPFTVRARLVDILLGDWDRHDDQWRWASFEDGKNTLYRPIPRDRDQVFFKFDGIVPILAGSIWTIKKFQDFGEEIKSDAGLSYNARYFDRFFLNEADQQTWLNQARQLQALITDSVIEAAIKDLPVEAYGYNGEELIQIVKVRRDKLVEFASRYYSILAKTVDVRGTLNEDYFEINRLANGDVEVKGYPRKDGKKVKDELFYNRVFKYGVTKEINIYGLDDKDEYKINGESRKSILVRIIAGENKDKIEDKSKVQGLRKKTHIYDVVGKADVKVSKESKLAIKNKNDALFYNRKEFKYNIFIPSPHIGFNPDDGITLGPQLKVTRHGFKKAPYKSQHTFAANYTFKAEGVNFNYSSDFIELFGKIDFGTSVEFNLPKVYQFYGQGNETSLEKSNVGKSPIRLSNYNFGTQFGVSSDDLSRRLSATLNYQILDVDELPVVVPEFDKLKAQQFIVGGLRYTYKNIVNESNPSRGIKFDVCLENTRSLLNADVDYTEVSSKFFIYVPINYFRKQTTFAARTGFSTLIGEYNFYQANFVGGTKEMRGLTRNRFAGKTVSYSNFELRRSFFKVKNYIVPFDFGIIGHFDIARVWVNKDVSEKWHNSYGGGIYVSILDFLSLAGTYSISDVNKTVNVGTNFYF